ncbi:MAG: glutathione S-transferase C-terminal domain-containing protein [Rubrivivax sp.]|nr:glutathione S-transferase C-terminal domain-containing protein [Rubrivivax sp.]
MEAALHRPTPAVGLARDWRVGKNAAGLPLTLEEAQQIGARALSLLDAQLARQPWLALGRPTVADVACYPYVALAPEGGVSLTPYPAVRGWLASFESLPGFVALPPS